MPGSIGTLAFRRTAAGARPLSAAEARRQWVTGLTFRRLILARDLARTGMLVAWTGIPGASHGGIAPRQIRDICVAIIQVLRGRVSARASEKSNYYKEDCKLKTGHATPHCILCT